MGKERKRYSAEFKLKAVLAVLKGDKTAAQLGGELQVHPMVLSNGHKKTRPFTAEFSCVRWINYLELE